MEKIVFEGPDGAKYEQFDQGNFSSKDRAIRVNDHAGKGVFATDFYKSLVTMLHENTHGYQNQLIDELKAGTLTEQKRQGSLSTDPALPVERGRSGTCRPATPTKNSRSSGMRMKRRTKPRRRVREILAEPDVHRDARQECKGTGRDQMHKLIGLAKADGLNDLGVKSLSECQKRRCKVAMRKDTSADILSGTRGGACAALIFLSRLSTSCPINWRARRGGDSYPEDEGLRVSQARRDH